jgi:hypothetical protein
MAIVSYKVVAEDAKKARVRRAVSAKLMQLSGTS